MELLLFVLFMLFSIVSSLLERRKRKRELENSRQAEAEKQQEQRQEEEVTVGWPFGGGRDPFEDEDLTRRFGDLQRLGEKGDEPEAMQVMEQETAPEPTSSSQTQVRASAKVSTDGYAKDVRRAGRWNIDARKAREAIVYSEILGPPKAVRSEEH